MERAFQVDLRGVVDLLGHHLYASPRVYLRELLQNAVDAITARQLAGLAAGAAVLIEPPEVTGDGTLRVSDTGIGLTEPEVHELLATIGRSSKRDDLGFSRHEFLGQFGIGLLSCFLVADEVQVLTRSARGGASVQWTGYSNGRYLVEPAQRERSEPGTTVMLKPRADMEHWLAANTVTELATNFGALLPVDISLAGRRANSGVVPWLAGYPSPVERRAALVGYAERLFGFTPFDVIDLEVSAAGLTGVAFVPPILEI
ncbi:MAG: HSP90 family protein, partial [Pseudonocardiales bacterium]